MQRLVTRCKTGEKSADKKLRLLEALVGQILFADFFGYSCCERDIFGRADRIHGFYCSVEAEGEQKACEGYASQPSESTARRGLRPCCGAWKLADALSLAHAAMQ
ncbi:hypothetical protein [Dyella sp.]|uniref:hypothetical protein n=1 Tax=Dyella sp. TaxID=1869338 RepID=UPI003F81C205